MKNEVLHYLGSQSLDEIINNKTILNLLNSIPSPILFTSIPESEAVQPSSLTIAFANDAALYYTGKDYLHKNLINAFSADFINTLLSEINNVLYDNRLSDDSQLSHKPANKSQAASFAILKLKDALMISLAEHSPLKQLQSKKSLNGVAVNATNSLGVIDIKDSFRNLVESYAQAVWESDASGNFINDSPSWRNYTGQTFDEFVGFGWLNAVHPDEREYAEKQWRKSVATKKNVNASFRIKFQSYGYRWSNVRATPIFDESGEVLKWTGMNIDIDERIKAEDQLSILTNNLEEEVAKRTAELQESRDVLRSVFDTTLIGMTMFKTIRNNSGEIVDFKIELVNKSVEHHTGRNDLVGKLYTKEYPGVKKTLLFKTMIAAVETGLPQQIEYYYGFDGFDNWYITLFKKLDDNIIATTLDITGRKQSETEKLKNLTLLEQSEELANAGSWEYDVEEKTFLCSEGIFKLFEIDKGSVVTPEILFKNIIEEDDEIAKKVRLNIQKRHKAFEETVRVKLKTSIKTIKIKALPLIDEAGKVESMLGVCIDITDQVLSTNKIKLLNTELQQKNRALALAHSEITTFNSIAAKDYKETLQQLYTNMEFIVSKEGRALSDSGKANLRRAQSAIQRMKLLTEDIVAYSKLQSFENEALNVNLNQLLATVTADLSEKVSNSNAIINTQILPVINGYPALLGILFYHLLDNALKFRKPGSSPKITISYSQVNTPFEFNDDDTNKYHCITIADNGIGFNNNESAKIFEIFYKLHDKNQYKGSGIGLAICKKIMDIHNGYIEANGEENICAEIRCYFPKAEV